MIGQPAFPHQWHADIHHLHKHEARNPKYETFLVSNFVLTCPTVSFRRGISDFLCSICYDQHQYLFFYTSGDDPPPLATSYVGEKRQLFFRPHGMFFYSSGDDLTSSDFRSSRRRRLSRFPCWNLKIEMWNFCYGDDRFRQRDTGLVLLLFGMATVPVVL